jgi:myxalamid-type polyketide synthase MxaE and MxaD
VAIVGIGCRFPAASGPTELWRNLVDGRDAITPGRPRQQANGPEPRPDSTATRWGGYLDGLDLFDAQFFGMAPIEAERLDPQHRLLLETTWEALEYAGLVPSRLQDSNTGVFVGLWIADYETRLYRDPAGIDFYMSTGTGRYSASGRMSHRFGWHGPSVSIDCACSSSLVAVHLACQALRARECDLAIAAAANTLLEPAITLAYSRAEMLAADGRCKFGDARADGYVRSEGAASIVLKRLSDAKAAGDPILAVVLGSAVNNDGERTGPFGRPATAGQRDLLRKAYASAGVDPWTVDYAEAHGTGTRAGDPVELEALADVLGAGRDASRPLLVGSVKTNIGHTEGAAGLAGLIKVALSLKNGAIPRSLHLQTPNPDIPWQRQPIRVVTEHTPWLRGPSPRVAGINSFGIAGTNGHVVLGESAEVREETPGSGLPLLVLSARSREALDQTARAWAQWLESGASGLDLSAIVRTAARKREHHDHRLAVVCSTVREAVDRLQAFASSESIRGVSYARSVSGARPQVAFVCPGQGGQWLGMGRQLLREAPAFRAEMERCDEAIARVAGWSLLERLEGRVGDAWLEDIAQIQPALFAMTVSLAALWRARGVQPGAIIGHSLGEVAAAHLAGALSLEDAARIACERSRLMKTVAGRGAMAVVELSPQEAAAAIADETDALSVAVCSSPTSTVIAGDPEAIGRVLARLETQGVFCRRIKVDVASHSPHMEGIRGELESNLAGLRPAAVRIPLCSTVTGEWMNGADLDAGYWGRNLRQPVLFSTAVERVARERPTAFVELSPHPLLLTPIRQQLEASRIDGSALGSLVRDEDEMFAMHEALGAVHVAGVSLDWDALVPGPTRPDLLPSYQWQRERFWFESDASLGGDVVSQPPTSRHAILPGYVALATQPGARVWQFTLDRYRMPFLAEHVLQGAAVLPASVSLELLLAAAGETLGEGALVLRGVEFAGALALGDESRPLLQLTAAPTGDGALDVRLFGVEAQVARLLVRARAERDAPESPGMATSAPGREGAEADAGFYRGLERRGITIGPSLQTVTSVTQTPTGVGATLSPPPSASSDAGPYRCHPAVTDGLLQLTAALESDLSVPFRCGEVRWHRSPSGPSRVEAERLAGEGAESRQTLRLFDAGGTVLELIDLGLRPLERAGRGALPARLEDWLYDVEWQESPVASHSTVKHPSREGTWVVFSGSPLGERVAEWLRRKAQKAIVVSRADACARRDATHYAIRPGHAEDFRSLVADVAGRDAPACRGVVYLWPIEEEAEADNVAGTEAAFSASVLPALRVMQALADVEWRDAPRVWLVTRGAQPARGDVSSPVHAALCGLGRVMAEEHAELAGGLVDLEVPGDVDADLEALAASIWEGDGEPEVAWRQGRRYVPRLVRLVQSGDRRAFACRADASYVVTGAFGGVGLAVARWLAAHGARRLVLVSRTPLPPRHAWRQLAPDSLEGARAAAVRELESSGVAVHVATLDASDPEAVADYFAAYDREGWPPVRGVVHCAAVVETALLRRLPPDAAFAVFRSKALAAVALEQGLASAPLDFFVSFSSIATLLPQPGQGAYVAANAFLDAWATRPRAVERPSLTVNWGVWRGLGQAAASARQGAEALEATGIGAFDAREALELLGRLVAGEAERAVVMPVDWTRFAESRRTNQIPLLSAILLQEQSARAAESGQATASFRDALAAAPVTDRRALLEQHLLEHLARVLRVPAARLDHQKPLGSMGLESLMTLAFRNRLEASLGIKLSATLVWNHPTIRALATYLAKRLELPLEEAAAPVPAPAAAEPRLPVAAAADLSDEDALRALIGGGD